MWGYAHISISFSIFETRCHNIAQADSPTTPPLYIFHVLGLQVCATKPDFLDVSDSDLRNWKLADAGKWEIPNWTALFQHAHHAYQADFNTKSKELRTSQPDVFSTHTRTLMFGTMWALGAAQLVTGSVITPIESDSSFEKYHVLV